MNYLILFDDVPINMDKVLFIECENISPNELNLCIIFDCGVRKVWSFGSDWDGRQAELNIFIEKVRAK
jgi:hypothetical protein